MRAILIRLLFVFAIFSVILSSGCEGDVNPVMEPIGNLQAIHITNAPTVPLAVGQMWAMGAMGNYPGQATYPLVKYTIWATSNSNVIRFNQKGVAQAVGGGSAVVSCNYRGVTSSAILLTVSGPPANPANVPGQVWLESINIIPAWVLANKNGTLQYIAVATYSNATTQQITDLVDWMVLDTGLGDISDVYNIRQYGDDLGIFHGKGQEGNTTVSCEYLNIFSPSAVIIVR